MEEKEFISECIKAFELNNIACTEAQAQKLYALTARMLEVNKTMNLTAIKDEKAIILKHYVDSITISPYIPQNSTIIDIGCGAGFPSLPLAVFRPDVKITALDGTAKRIAYVNETAKYLGLTNLTAISARAEELALTKEYRECFDIVTARAVASLPVLCELCLPYVKLGGSFVAMKSKQADDELAASRKCIEICGGGEPRKISSDLKSDNEENDQRSLIIVPKIKETPKNYPRHYSKISKKPL